MRRTKTPNLSWLRILIFFPNLKHSSVFSQNYECTDKCNKQTSDCTFITNSVTKKLREICVCKPDFRINFKTLECAKFPDYQKPTCPLGFHKSTIDGTCSKKNICTCTHFNNKTVGIPAENEKCYVNNENICDSCFDYYHKASDIACVPNVCVCDFGMSKQKCSVHGSEFCEKDFCDPGYHMEEIEEIELDGRKFDRCVKNECLCDNGLPLDFYDDDIRDGFSTLCPIHQGQSCFLDSCNPGYQIVPGRVIEIKTTEKVSFRPLFCETIYKCRCENGIVAEGLDCPDNGVQLCISCNDGFDMTGDRRCECSREGYRYNPVTETCSKVYVTANSDHRWCNSEVEDCPYDTSSLPYYWHRFNKMDEIPDLTDQNKEFKSFEIKFIPPDFRQVHQLAILLCGSSNDFRYGYPGNENHRVKRTHDSDWNVRIPFAESCTEIIFGGMIHDFRPGHQNPRDQLTAKLGTTFMSLSTRSLGRQKINTTAHYVDQEFLDNNGYFIQDLFDQRNEITNLQIFEGPLFNHHRTISPTSKTQTIKLDMADDDLIVHFQQDPSSNELTEIFHLKNFRYKKYFDHVKSIGIGQKFYFKENADGGLYGPDAIHSVSKSWEESKNAETIWFDAKFETQDLPNLSQMVNLEVELKWQDGSASFPLFSRLARFDLEFSDNSTVEVYLNNVGSLSSKNHTENNFDQSINGWENYISRNIPKPKKYLSGEMKFVFIKSLTIRRAGYQCSGINRGGKQDVKNKTLVACLVLFSTQDKTSVKKRKSCSCLVFVLFVLSKFLEKFH